MRLDGNPVFMHHTVKAVSMDSNAPALQNGSGARRLRTTEERRSRILTRCRIFEALTAEVRERVLTGSALVDADRRESLCMPSDPAIFVIGSGRVRRVRRTPERELTLGYYGPGDLIGEMSLVDPEARLETVVLDYVEALRIPPRLIKMVMAEDLEFASAMHRLMGERRLLAERRIDALLTRSVESRVAEFLLDASSRHGIPDSRGILVGSGNRHIGARRLQKGRRDRNRSSPRRHQRHRRIA
jgi:CRP-like cAMP-binding protein